MFVFVHIPKNSGTSFLKILERIYGKGLKKFYTDRMGDFISKQQFLEQSDRFRATSGHDIRPFEEYLDRLDYFTFLRDPIDRAISLYYYEKKNKKGRNHPAKKSFEEYVRIRGQVDNAISNFQTFNLVETGFATDAIELVKNFKSVGLTHKFDQSIVVLSDKMNWDLSKLKYIRKNTSYKRKISKNDLDTQTLEFLEQINSEDIKLYNWAVENFNKEIESIVDFEEKLLTFRNINKYYNLYKIPEKALSYIYSRLKS